MKAMFFNSADAVSASVTAASSAWMKHDLIPMSQILLSLCLVRKAPSNEPNSSLIAPVSTKIAYFSTLFFS